MPHYKRLVTKTPIKVYLTAAFMRAVREVSLLGQIFPFYLESWTLTLWQGFRQNNLFNCARKLTHASGQNVLIKVKIETLGSLNHFQTNKRAIRSSGCSRPVRQ